MSQYHRRLLTQRLVRALLRKNATIKRCPIDLTFVAFGVA